MGETPTPNSTRDNTASREGSSFRDPSGFVYQKGNSILRQVNRAYKSEFENPALVSFLQNSVKAGQLVPFSFLGPEMAFDDQAIAVLEAERIQFISYPYEWSFSQLKDAALLTLSLAKSALDHGLALKDATAYNVQFKNGKPIFIDLLSFEKYVEGTPWVAYKQFCQHFLAPLALMSYVDPSLNRLLRIHLDGIPLQLASKLLPFSTRFKFGLLTHIHLHAKGTNQVATQDTKSVHVPKVSLLALLDNLTSVVNSLAWNPSNTEWGDYYSDTNYAPQAMDHKRDTVRSWLSSIFPKPTTCWDLGANTGAFSTIATELGLATIAWDIDPAAVEKAYLANKDSGKPLLPLTLDLTNPSPNIGWNLEERHGWTQRGKPDVVMALALIHHLAIGNNTPLSKVAEQFAELAEWAIVEFVPKSDSQVQRMLGSRKDVFDDYTEDGFVQSFDQNFNIIKSERVLDSDRTLYLLQRRS